MGFTSLAVHALLALQVGCALLPRTETPNTLKPRASSWVYVGCYSDSVSSRGLPNEVSVPGGSSSMTNENCKTACQAGGYLYAGNEYGGECWCNNEFVDGSAPIAASLCDMSCNGDSSETCGGPNALSVYEYVASAPVTGKRGLAWSTGNPDGNAVYANLFTGYPLITWAYNWGFPKLNLDNSFDFVPELWGLPSGPDPSWTSAVELAKEILGFNEPDLTYSGSSNILPAPAAAGYQTYMEPFSGTYKISTPNVLWNNIGSSSGGNYDSAQWMHYFMGNCTGCHFDFAAIHYYQNCNDSSGSMTTAVNWFKNNITNCYSTLNLPIWITEFQCYGTEAEQISWLQIVLPWLDSVSYVARYAYFGVFPGYLVNSAGTAPSDLGITFATYTGS